MFTDNAAELLADAIHDLAAALRGLPYVPYYVRQSPVVPYVPQNPQPNTVPMAYPRITYAFPAIPQADGEPSNT